MRACPRAHCASKTEGKEIPLELNPIVDAPLEGARDRQLSQAQRHESFRGDLVAQREDGRIVPFLVQVPLDRTELVDVRTNVIRLRRSRDLETGERLFVAHAIVRVVADGHDLALRAQAALTPADFTVGQLRNGHYRSRRHDRERRCRVRPRAASQGQGGHTARVGGVRGCGPGEWA